MINGSENATIMLSNGIILHIENALLSTKTKRNLLSFKDVRHNRYNLETIIEADINCLYIISYKMGIKTIHEKNKSFNFETVLCPHKSYRILLKHVLKIN